MGEIGGLFLGALACYKVRDVKQSHEKSLRRKAE